MSISLSLAIQISGRRPIPSNIPEGKSSVESFNVILDFSLIIIFGSAPLTVPFVFSPI